MKVAQVLYSGLGGHGSVVFSLLRGGAQAEWTNALLFFGIEPVTAAYREAAAALGARTRSIEVAPGRRGGDAEALDDLVDLDLVPLAQQVEHRAQPLRPVHPSPSPAESKSRSMRSASIATASRPAPGA